MEFQFLKFIIYNISRTVPALEDRNTMIKKTFTTMATKLTNTDVACHLQKLLSTYATKDLLKETIQANAIRYEKKWAHIEKMNIINVSKLNDRLASSERYILSTIDNKNQIEFWKFTKVLGAGCVALIGLGGLARSELREDLQKVDDKVDKLKEDIQRLDKKLDDLDHKFDKKLDDLDHKLSKKLDGLDHKFDRLLERSQVRTE